MADICPKSRCNPNFIIGSDSGSLKTRQAHMADKEFNAVVNFDKAVDLEQSYDLDIAAAQFERLAQSCVSLDAPVHAVYRFFRDLQGLRTIEGEIICPKITFRCERCGQNFSQELRARFRSTVDGQKAASLRIEEKLDVVECDPSGDFRLLDYLEDCLLLEVPFAPRHPENDPDCVKGSEWSYGELAPEASVHPFAALEGLRGKLKR